jgi:hypothetical protein
MCSWRCRRCLRARNCITHCGAAHSRGYSKCHMKAQLWWHQRLPRTRARACCASQWPITSANKRVGESSEGQAQKARTALVVLEAGVVRIDAHGERALSQQRLLEHRLIVRWHYLELSERRREGGVVAARAVDADVRVICVDRDAALRSTDRLHSQATL